MQEKLNSVASFHTSFGLNVSQSPTVDLKNEIINLRFKLMAEENEEYLEAARNKDIVEVADALGDMLYILCGTIIEHEDDFKQRMFRRFHILVAVKIRSLVSFIPSLFFLILIAKIHLKLGKSHIYEAGFKFRLIL